MRSSHPASITALATGIALALPSCGTHHNVQGGPWSLRAQAERNESHPLTIEDRGLLRVEVPAGAIAVVSTAQPGEEPRVDARIVAHAKSDELAVALLEETVLEVRDAGSEAVVSFEQPRRDRSGWVAIDVSARVPAGTAVHCVSHSGAIELRGPLGAATARSDYGDLSVADVTGNLIAETQSGSVTVERVVADTVELRSSYGDLKVSEVRAESIHAETSSGTVHATQLEGGGISLRSDYGDVRVDGLRGDLEARTDSGRIEVRELAGSATARSGYGDVLVDGRIDRVAATSSSGTVSVVARAGSRCAAEWTLETEYGDVSLHLPEEFSAELSAETDYGEIELDRPLLVEGGAFRRSGPVRGKLGEGGPPLTLRTSSGSIRIRTLAD